MATDVDAAEPTYAPLDEPVIIVDDVVAEYRREIYRGKIGGIVHFAIMRTTESKLDSVLIWHQGKQQWVHPRSVRQESDCYHAWALDLHERTAL